jgi:peptidoglycan-N-acetylglucosamine deacetylase
VKAITLTIDLEDPTDAYSPNGRWVQMTHRVLNFCDKVKHRATFFTVGRIAGAAPELVKTIAARGHEIAYHTRGHVPLTEENPKTFRRETREDKDRLEQLTGQPVIGFRAPGFSLTPHATWALDILNELDFLYSSSVMPTRLARYGFPDAPRVPFLWPNGLIEFPLPVANIGPLRVPYLGGVYLYALPSFLTRMWAESADAKECLWTYTHPYDFDTHAPFKPLPGTPLWMSWIIWMLRHRAEKKLSRLLQKNAPNLSEIVVQKNFVESLKTFKHTSANFP